MSPKQALERIDMGDFGICDACGEDISIPRLKARPVTTQCIECKTEAEAQCNDSHCHIAGRRADVEEDA